MKDVIEGYVFGRINKRKGLERLSLQLKWKTFMACNYPKLFEKSGGDYREKVLRRIYEERKEYFQNRFHITFDIPFWRVMAEIVSRKIGNVPLDKPQEVVQSFLGVNEQDMTKMLEYTLNVLSDGFVKNAMDLMKDVPDETMIVVRNMEFTPNENERRLFVTSATKGEKMYIPCMILENPKWALIPKSEMAAVIKSILSNVKDTSNLDVRTARKYLSEELLKS